MSNIGHLLARYREHPAVIQLLQALDVPGARVHLGGMTGAQTAFALAATLTVDGGRLTVDGGRLTVDGGRLTVDGGGLTVDGGRSTVDGGGSTVDGGGSTVAGGETITPNAPLSPSDKPSTVHRPPSTVHCPPSTVHRPPSTVLYIAESKEEAAYLLNDLQGILPEELVFFFPDSFKRPAFFDDLNPTQTLQRSEVVNKISARNGNPAPGGVVVTYPEALFEKVVAPEVLAQSRIDVAKGETLDVDFVIQVLVEYGFERTDFVYEPGQFSVRGGIIDLFSYGNEFPYRIELFDDEVESIRTFEPLTQLSKQNIGRVSIVPNLNTRFRQDQKVSLFRVLPADTVLWIRDFQFLLDRLQYCFEKAEVFARKISALDSAELKEIFRDRAFLYPGDVVEDVREHRIVFLEKPGAAVTEMLKA